MEANQGDLLGNVIRPPSVRVSRSFRTSKSLTSSPSSSPSYKRIQSTKTPRKEDEPFRVLHILSKYSNRRLPWIILIGIWIILVLKVYSKGPSSNERFEEQQLRQHITLNTPKHEKNIPGNEDPSGKSRLSRIAREWIWNGYLRHSRLTPPDYTNSSEPTKSTHGRTYTYTQNSTLANFAMFQALQTGEHFLGRVVGPYDKLEENILLLNKSLTTVKPVCSSVKFQQFVRDKRFVILMHELSMTGSPLAMMELATDIINCGGKVSIVVLDKRGGLYNELTRRRISLVLDKSSKSWRAASRAHLVIAGSAVCASWIDGYLRYNRKGASRIVWWIMENRREYFDRTRQVLGRVRAIIFLSNIQAQRWREWSTGENISLPQHSDGIVNLSVNDVIMSLPNNTLTQLRAEVRKDMGLNENDMLFATLSSINPGKGQLVALQAASIVLKKQSKSSQSKPAQSMKLLIGSVGSKSNKPEYVERMLSLLSENAELANSVLWTPASVHVPALYAAADVYLMNAQGIGETFGRVTVEAMAFGLPILGTDAGGTKEIVDANRTGLLHPVGMKGAEYLAENMLLLLERPTLGKQMGERGKTKVKEFYTKSVMYNKLALAFTTCCS